MQKKKKMAIVICNGNDFDNIFMLNNLINLVVEK